MRPYVLLYRGGATVSGANLSFDRLRTGLDTAPSALLGTDGMNGVGEVLKKCLILSHCASFSYGSYRAARQWGKRNETGRLGLSLRVSIAPMFAVVEGSGLEAGPFGFP